MEYYITFYIILINPCCAERSIFYSFKARIANAISIIKLNMLT